MTEPIGNTELKPCPFCGGTFYLVWNDWKCDSCNAVIPGPWRFLVNERPIEDALNARIEELEAEYATAVSMFDDWQALVNRWKRGYAELRRENDALKKAQEPQQ